MSAKITAKIGMYLYSIEMSVIIMVTVSVEFIMSIPRYMYLADLSVN